MFKKLLPILGLLLLVSCQIDTEDTELCANGDQDACQRIADSLTTHTPPPPPKPINDWLDKADFLTDKTCTVTETTLTDEFINEVGSNETSVNYLIGQEMKLGGGTYSHSKSTGREYIGFQSDATLNGNVRLFISTNKEGTHNSFNVGTPSGNTDENLSIRTFYTLNDAGTLVGTMVWMRTDVGRDVPQYTMFDEVTEVFTITLKCK